MRYEVIEETLLVGLSTVTASSFSEGAEAGTQEIYALWDRLRGTYEEIAPTKEIDFFGASRPFDEHVPPLQVWYFAGFPNTEAVDGLDSFVIPKGKYLVYSHRGEPSTFDDAVRVAYLEEFPKSGSELRDGPHLERYRYRGPRGGDILDVDIMIPIK
jgi:predicted transcriptional regulator YdeE